MTPPDHHDLERLVDQTLRDLPPRRAPRSLETRVLAAIAARAALPWWRKSFTYWPQPARIGFVGVSLAIVAAHFWVLTGLDVSALGAAIAAKFSWLGAVATLGATIREFCQVVLRSIPPIWLYGGLALVASSYAARFGLGATAYRALYATR